MAKLQFEKMYDTDIESVNQYITSVKNNIKKGDGEALAKLFDINGIHKQLTNFVPTEVENLILSDSIWKDMLICHLNVVECLNKTDLRSAFEKQFELTKLLYDLYDKTDDNCFLPLMNRIIIDLRCLSYLSDTVRHSEDVDGNISPSNVIIAKDILIKLFGKCVNESRSQYNSSKRTGIVAIGNQLFKIYFSINQYNMCKSLILAVENFGVMERYSISEQVTFNYYAGRLALFENNYSKASNYLTFAFENCHRDYVRNKRLILIYLIPAKMLLGIFPCEPLLEKYNLEEFIGVVNSVRNGNLYVLNQQLIRHSSFFIRCGVYLILENLRQVAYRNLFKLTWQIIGSHMISISAFTDALRFLGVIDVDIDETECILANLIYENKIKGYLAHQQQKLVMSKANAFPAFIQSNTSLNR